MCSLLKLVAGLREGPADKQNQRNRRRHRTDRALSLLRFREDHFVTGAPQAARQRFSRSATIVLRPPITTSDAASARSSASPPDRGTDRSGRWFRPDSRLRSRESAVSLKSSSTGGLSSGSGYGTTCGTTSVIRASSFSQGRRLSSGPPALHHRREHDRDFRSVSVFPRIVTGERRSCGTTSFPGRLPYRRRCLPIPSLRVGQRPEEVIEKA